MRNDAEQVGARPEIRDKSSFSDPISVYRNPTEHFGTVPLREL
jgi:hypothetical protein